MVQRLSPLRGSLNNSLIDNNEDQRKTNTSLGFGHSRKSSQAPSALYKINEENPESRDYHFRGKSFDGGVKVDHLKHTRLNKKLANLTEEVSREQMERILNMPLS